MKIIKKIIDKSTDIMCICIGISAIIFITIFSINTTEDWKEQECVKFYKENKYITESCQIYRERLEKIKE